MVLKHAAWIHGTAVQLESSSWSALRQGFYSTVRPSNEGPSGWVHFPIPTPVIVDDVRLKAGSALIRFSTGPGAVIRAVHVYDGERNISENNGLNLTGQLQLQRFNVPGTPQVLWGTVICVNIEFKGSFADNYIQLISAGIDFLN